MNVSNLEVGRTYKSYKELCEVLGISNMGGDTKIKNLKELDRYIEYEKEGNKFHVLKMYPIPLPPSNNITSYAPMVERLLLHILVTQSDSNNRLYIRKNNLLQLLNLINNKYGQMKWKQFQLSKEFNIPRSIIVDFYTTSDDAMKRNIERALNSLKNQSLIQWNYVFSVCKLDISGERNYEDELTIDVLESNNEYGDVVKDYRLNTGMIYKYHREATDDETKAILRYQREIMKEYGIAKLNEVFKMGKQKEFYEKVYKKMQDNYNIEFYYESLSIIFNLEHVTERYETAEHFIIEDESREIIENTINDEVIDKLLSNAYKRHKKALNGQGIMIETRSDRIFLNGNITLCNNLIDNGRDK